MIDHLLLGLALCACVVSLGWPWVAVLSILTAEVLGSLSPVLQDVRALSAVAVCGAVGSLRFMTVRGIGSWAVLWPLAYLGVFFFSYLTHGLLPAGFVYLLCGAFATYYLVLFAIRTPGQWRFIAAGAILVAVVLSVSVMLDLRGALLVSRMDDVYAGRIHDATRALIGNPNYMFPLVMPGLLFAALIAQNRSDSRVRIAGMVVLGVISCGVLSTLSRGSVLSLGATAMVYLILSGRLSSPRRAMASCLAIIGIGGITAAIFPELFLLLADRFAANDIIDGNRAELARMALQGVAQSPVWGSGVGTSLAVLGVTQHDGFLGNLGELGVVGFLVLYSLPLLCLLRLERSRRWLGRLRQPERAEIIATLEAFLIGIAVLNAFNNVVFSKTVLAVFAFTQLIALESVVPFRTSPGRGEGTRGPSSLHDLTPLVHTGWMTGVASRRAGINRTIDDQGGGQR